MWQLGWLWQAMAARTDAHAGELSSIAEDIERVKGMIDERSAQINDDSMVRKIRAALQQVSVRHCHCRVRASLVLRCACLHRRRSAAWTCASRR